VGLTVVAAAQPTLAVVLGIAVAYFAGLGALQFHPRHTFHLEFLGWLGAALTTKGALDVYRARIHVRQLWRGAWAPVVALGLATVLLVGTRAYQQAEATKLFDRYLASERQPLDLQEETSGDTVTLHAAGLLPDVTGVSKRVNDPPADAAYYLALVWDERRCPGQRIAARIAYHETPFDDFSRDVTISLGESGRAYMFFPVFACTTRCLGNPRFAGVIIAASQRACLQGIEAVAHYDALPLPLWLRLDSNWRTRPLYQTIDTAQAGLPK
jgi:hypothetical protein